MIITCVYVHVAFVSHVSYDVDTLSTDVSLSKYLCTDNAFVHRFAAMLDVYMYAYSCNVRLLIVAKTLVGSFEAASAKAVQHFVAAHSQSTS